MEADNDTKVLMAKWDIQDGFWQLNCRKGEEWNFCYVWPQAPGKPRRLMVPSSLQMGWVESAPYFCTESKTAQDMAAQYIETEIGLLLRHKIKQWAGADFTQIHKNTPTRELCMSLRCTWTTTLQPLYPRPKPK